MNTVRFGLTLQRHKRLTLLDAKALFLMPHSVSGAQLQPTLASRVERRQLLTLLTVSARLGQTKQSFFETITHTQLTP